MAYGDPPKTEKISTALNDAIKAANEKLEAQLKREVTYSNNTNKWTLDEWNRYKPVTVGDPLNPGDFYPQRSSIEAENKQLRTQLSNAKGELTKLKAQLEILKEIIYSIHEGQQVFLPHQEQFCVYDETDTRMMGPFTDYYAAQDAMRYLPKGQYHVGRTEESL